MIAAGDPRPERVGHFEILDVLGEGGMGTVYLAEQREPVKRRVALKLIKLGMDTKRVLARFETERQALALMEHDNIAKVFDADATEDGRPYFVMEYVKGSPITTYCDKQRLAISERLELLRQVCAGVQHAHQKGVIHRDLKPGNILVTTQSEKPVPKIIDFGLARATDPLVEATFFTEHGQVIGTPEYMSPEQAGRGGLGVDTRSDIYSLGVLLYELLTGALPFDPEKVRAAGYVEMQRRIREEDPPKPSTKVMSSRQDKHDTAHRRHIESAALTRALRGDLDWITMRCLEKDPTRRYQAATELAADLERHLQHEPVEASPPSRTYRLKKFLRKRRGPVAAAVAVFLALVVGLAVAWWQWGRAETSLERAQGAEREAKSNLEMARENERAAKRSAEEAKRALAAESKALASYQRMRDVPLCEDLLAEADRELWPAHPDNVAAMDTWLQRAGELVGRARSHRQRLDELRAKALPPGPEVEAKAHELDRLRIEWAEKMDNLERARKGKSRRAKQAAVMLQKELQQLTTRARTLEEQIAPLRWRFERYEDRFQHVVFADLVRKLEQLTGEVLPSVTERRERAATLEQRSIAAYEEVWDRTIRELAKADDVVASNRYEGMPVLKPQLALVPLGMDSQSKLHEFAVLDTGNVPRREEDGELEIDGESAIVLVLIPPGTFWMGAEKSEEPGPNRDPWAEEDEAPVHEVELDAFFLSKYEMTQGQWLRLMGQSPSDYARGNQVGGRTITLRNPVENVSWFDCREATRRLRFVLPTEAQWEYAARAGTTGVWWTGNEKSTLQGAANLADAYCKANGGPSTWSYDEDLDDGHGIHAPVGTYAANAFGLHDVVGNVWEWCQDWFGPYEVAPNPGDGLRVQTSARYRVNRGGSFNLVARLARSADRSRSPPVDRGIELGLRPAVGITQ